MGGMALGSVGSTHAFVAKRDPIRTFALLEGFIGLYALVSPALLHSVGAVPGQELRFVLALTSLLPATIAMGASLPLLVRAFAHERVAVGLGQLYAVNTAGAVLGPLLAVFWLFPGVGLEATLWIGAALDFLVATSLLLWRRRHPSDMAPAPSPVEDAPSSVPGAVLAAVAVSGASAMVYEVAWGRTLSMVYGSSVYGVSIMLSTFLLGLTLGSALAARYLRRYGSANQMLRLAKALIASATLAFASLIVARSLPFVFLNFYASIEGRDVTLFFSQFVIAGFLMLPCTMALGATLPLAADAMSKGPIGNVGRRIAKLYSWNLIGSALGALSASGILMSTIGIEFTIRFASVAVLVVAIVLVARAASFSISTGAFAGSAILIILALDPSGERVMKSFGIYSGVTAYAKYDMTQLRQVVASHSLLYYRDGPTATVAVQQIDRFKLLKINGKTDASNGPGDMATQLLLGHLPFLATEAKQVAVIGWGSGMTVGAVLKHPVEKVRAFEIEPAVVEASRLFEPENGSPLSDDRVELVMGDARTELRQGSEPYDLIISAPSNPWLTGVSNLFTRDFFELASSRLTPNGIHCQWFQLYGMSESSTRSLIATFREVYPHAVAFQDRDLLLIGSHEPLSFSMEKLREFYDDSSIGENLERAKMAYPSDVLASMTMDDEGTRAFAEGGESNTDDNMLLELQAPRSLYRDDAVAILRTMHGFPIDVLRHLDGLDSEPDLRTELAASYFTKNRFDEALRQVEQAVALESSFEGQKLRGQILERLGRSDEAKEALEHALEAGGDPAGRRFVEAMLRSLGPSVGP